MIGIKTQTLLTCSTVKSVINGTLPFNHVEKTGNEVVDQKFKEKRIRKMMMRDPLNGIQHNTRPLLYLPSVWQQKLLPSWMKRLISNSLILPCK